MTPGRLTLAAAIGWIALAPAPARADIEWVPEGRFFARYSFPVHGGGRSGLEPNFDLVAGRLGTRLRIAPGISLRAVGEIYSLDRTRRVGDLQLGYAEWDTGSVGTLRLGQVPAFRDVEENTLGDYVLGPGVATAAGFFYPSGLGLSWTQAFDLAFATSSIDVHGMFTEGFPGSGALADNPIFPGMLGPGPAALAHAAFGLPGGLGAHIFGRYGYLVDQQAAVMLTQGLGDFNVLVTAASSASTPQGLPPVADAAAMTRVRYNLGGWSDALWRTDVIGRLQGIFRNFTNTPQVDPSFPVVGTRTDLQSTLAVQYRITDNSVVALDVTDDRTVAPTATSSLFLGVRAGLIF